MFFTDNSDKRTTINSDTTMGGKHTMENVCSNPLYVLYN